MDNDINIKKKTEIEYSQQQFREQYVKKIKKKKRLQFYIGCLFLLFDFSLLLIMGVSIQRIESDVINVESIANKYVIVNKLAYIRHDMMPGELICYEIDNVRHIGRIIALDSSEITINNGQLFQNKELLMESSYLDQIEITPDYKNNRYQINDGELFILVDQRETIYTKSLVFDSRNLDVPIKKDDVIGKIMNIWKFK